MLDGLTAEEIPPQLVMSPLFPLANNGGVGTIFSLTRPDDEHRHMHVTQNTAMEFSISVGDSVEVRRVEFAECMPANYSTLFSRQDHFYVPVHLRQQRVRILTESLPKPRARYKRTSCLPLPSGTTSRR
eukprot:SAG25_NODE_4866_length_739_cov_1.571875_1_plen_129_part_00